MLELHREVFHRDVKLPENYIKKIQSDIQNILMADLPYIREIHLFGSCARGQVTNTSDVDLAIICDDVYDHAEISSLKDKVEKMEFGVTTDCMVRTYHSGYSNVFENEYLKDYIVIWRSNI